MGGTDLGRQPAFADIEDAARGLVGVAVETPLLNFPELDRQTGGRILVKPEILQRTGSFKFRGAYTKLSRLDAERRAKGVVAYSSGNHAQGVAASAQLLKVPATIIMPSDAPRMKIDNTRGYGATVRLYEKGVEDRVTIGEEIAQATGATLVRPYDDFDVISGQGTCGLEIARQCDSRGEKLDAALFCCGGGGLTAGSSLALAEISPGTAVYTVEPEGFDDTLRSLSGGSRVSNSAGGRSFCDALLAAKPGELTFAINSRLDVHGLAVSDAEVRRAMAFAYSWMKLVIEPGGAVCLAAVLSGKLDVAGKTISIVLSGGNVDARTFSATIMEVAE